LPTKQKLILSNKTDEPLSFVSLTSLSLILSAAEKKTVGDLLVISGI